MKRDRHFAGWEWLRLDDNEEEIKTKKRNPHVSPIL